MKRLVLALFVLAAPATGVEVLYDEADSSTVVIRRKPRTLNVGNLVCLPPSAGGIRCGQVVGVSAGEATVFITVRAEGIDIEPPAAPAAVPSK